MTQLSKSQTLTLVQELKDTDQDFEWYPTTNEIMDTIKSDMEKYLGHGSVGSPTMLDCGAGDGRVLKYLTNGAKYAIEKSVPLINQLANNDIFIVGTDFDQQTLIDKDVDIIFCNPPYTKFAEWSIKIINESRASFAYLVIPDRWENNDNIQFALKDRKADAEVIGSFDFLKADRAARANVDIVRVDFDSLVKYHGHNGRCRHYKSNNTDPFDTWFKNTFDFELDNKASKSESQIKKDICENLSEAKSTHGKNGLIKNEGLVKTLETLYNKDLDEMFSLYVALSNVDALLIKELGADLPAILGSLKLKIKTLKDVYWHELFDNLGTITDKLTKASRDKMLDTLTKNTSVDFSAGNAHGIVIWCIQNANKYFDSQLVDTYSGMIEECNIKKYKSNQKIFENKDFWYSRYEARGKITDISLKLDGRLVVSGYGGLDDGDSWRGDSENGLAKRAGTFLSDIQTIASNLGFDTSNSLGPHQYDWKAKKSQVFDYMDISDNKEKELMKVTAHYNGNMHIKFNQKFLMKLNVEFGRLKGWLNSTEQAADELEIEESEVDTMFQSNFSLCDKSTFAQIGYSG